MPSMRSSHPSSNRRALLGAISLLALPAGPLAAPAATSPAADSDVWPRAQPVPGGVARLSLGPAATRPEAFAGDVPLLVVGDAREWTAVVGIALAAAPGPAHITVRAPGGGTRQGPYRIAPQRHKIGRAACRGKGEVSGVRGSFKK